MRYVKPALLFVGALAVLWSAVMGALLAFGVENSTIAVRGGCVTETWHDALGRTTRIEKAC